MRMTLYAINNRVDIYRVPLAHSGWNGQLKVLLHRLKWYLILLSIDAACIFCWKQKE